MDANTGGLPAEAAKVIRGAGRAMTRLVKLPGSPDEPVRLAAFAAPGVWGVPAIGYLGIGLFMSEDSAYRVRVVEALRRLAPLPHQAVLLTLAHAARDGDPAVRRAAVSTVMRLGGYPSAEQAGDRNGPRGGPPSDATTGASATA